MSEKLSIKINVANRLYPMKVEKESEEQIRSAAKLINERIEFYEKNYETNDKQDLLAMCLIEFATSSQNLNYTNKKEKINLLADLKSIEEMILNKIS